MSSPGIPASSASAAAAAAPAPVPAPFSTPTLLATMLRSAPRISDLFFSPGKPPMVEVNSRLSPVGAKALTSDDTRHIAGELIGNNKHAIGNLREKGSCDVSYSLSGSSRFRVNIFMQRGSCAIVMRVIPSKVPSFDELNLPAELQKIVGLRNGIVLVTGPTGSGKSSTLAAVIDLINKQQSFHILTIEDPIEFLHPHQNCIVHQRELHSDTTSFALALRAALRQAPKVILVGEMRDRETIEIAMEAAETGHLSNVNVAYHRRCEDGRTNCWCLPVGRAAHDSESPGKEFSLYRFATADSAQRWQRTTIEILKSTLRTREYVEKGEGEGKTLLDAMRVGTTEGMQHFDGEIERLIRAGTIDYETGMAYATNAGNLRLELADFAPPLEPEQTETRA